MACSDAGKSSGSKYQVFLSFRGPDTRVGFTDFLFHSLIDAGIRVFRDKEELRVGERIEGSLLQAIEDSKIYIPIFSDTYASSKWCLRELTHIVANTFKPEDEKVIFPIFYDVEPDDVKLKTPVYVDAILNLESEKELPKEQVDAWRNALKAVGAVKGWEVKKYDGHAEVIKLVIEGVLEKLKTKYKSVTEQLVGMDDQVAAVSKLVDINSDGVRLIKIHGMGGIGKTTLVKVIFNQLSSHFGKSCCFLEDVRTNSSRPNGLVDLQKRLLSEIGHTAGTQSINNTDYGTRRIEEVLGNKKILLVLDDVDNNEQVENLVGKITFCQGSRILITTRNKDVQDSRSSRYKVDNYEMKAMSTSHALELFKRYTFNIDFPLDDYDNLSKEVVNLIGGLPLAVEVIGRFLCCKQQEVWKETLEKIRKEPHEDVFGKLKISYDKLNLQQQQIFLDIACFFIGKNMTNAIYMWKDCGFFPYTGVEVLINRSLIKIVEENKFWMHDQLRDFGRKIVHLEKLSEKQSRIWTWEEGLDALTSKEMDNNVEALSLETYGEHLHDIGKAVESFKRLRFLKLSGLTLAGDALNHLSKLRWTSFKYPLNIYNWTDMYLKNIVILEFFKVSILDDSTLQKLLKMATKLKVLYLEGCEGITRTPNFFGCPNLERLTFENCRDLREIGGSIEKLQNLEVLIVRNCKLEGKLPSVIGSLPLLKELNLSGTDVSEIPESISMLPCLQRIELLHCDMIQKLPMLPKSLTHLKVSSSSLQVVPNLSNLTNLVELELSDFGNRWGEHCTGELWWIGRLCQLTKLRIKLDGVRLLTEISSLPLLEELRFFGLDMRNCSLLNLSNLENFDPSMQEIQLHEVQLPQLIECFFRNCNHLVSLKLSRMRKLTRVEVSECPELAEIQIFGALESLEHLEIVYCDSFERIVYEPANELIDCEGRLILLSRVFNKLRQLTLWGCDKILDIEVVGASESLLNFNVVGCRYLESIDGLSYLKNLKWLSIEDCDRLHFVEGINELESLGQFEIRKCGSLETLIDVATTKLSDDCHVFIDHCRKLYGVEKRFYGSVQSFKHYKELAEASQKQEEREEDAMQSSNLTISETSQQEEEREEDVMQLSELAISETAQQEEEREEVVMQSSNSAIFETAQQELEREENAMQSSESAISETVQQEEEREEDAIQSSKLTISEAAQQQKEREMDAMRSIKSAILISVAVVSVAGAIFSTSNKLREK